MSTTITWLDDVRDFVPVTSAFALTPAGTILIDIPEPPKPMEPKDNAPVQD